MEEIDMVIIGAGLSGLAVAKAFHQLNSDKSLVILEAAFSLGGTWAKDRLYPGLKSNNMIGTTSPAPAGADIAAPLTPYHLYRFMVPATDRLLQSRDIAFAGMMLPAQVLPPKSEAKKDGGSRIRSKSLEDVRYETVLHSRFGKWRYPAGNGARFPDFVFDGVPYMDLLLHDLGLRVHRKSGWLAEITEPNWIAPKRHHDYNLEAEAITDAMLGSQACNSPLLLTSPPLSSCGAAYRALHCCSTYSLLAETSLLLLPRRRRRTHKTAAVPVNSTAKPAPTPIPAEVPAVKWLLAGSGVGLVETTADDGVVDDSDKVDIEEDGVEAEVEVEVDCVYPSEGTVK
ncbi:uncharacterized protein PG986_011306 [Apiospora aurea]|uniref:Flavin-containing monooxygenase n=1 Tax=Apiospora aurea TaxID=335848 RepID=A0ABR1Q4S2_9PEZI